MAYNQFSKNLFFVTFIVICFTVPGDEKPNVQQRDEFHEKHQFMESQTVEQHGRSPALQVNWDIRKQPIFGEKDIAIKHGHFQVQEKEGFTLESHAPLRQRERNRRSRNSESNPLRVYRRFCIPKDQCTGNKTVFDYVNSFNCACDNDCFETFQDCCPFYEEHCGNQTTAVGRKQTPKFPFTWKCVALGLKYDGECTVAGATGVWMIQECPSSWPFHETRRKCHNAPANFSHPVEDYVPVVADNEFTYRNKHCAVCHGVHKYTSWNIRVKTFVTPPTEYDLDGKLRFVIENGGIFQHVGPTKYQPRRYCAVGKYKEKCNDSSHLDNKDCWNGPVEVVVNRKYFFFKNKACASCNGYPKTRFWLTSSPCFALPEGFAIVFKTNNRDIQPSNDIIVKECPYGSVYDKNLEYCRKAQVTSAADNLSNEFLVVLWFGRSSITYNTSIFQRHFRAALTENFNLLQTQISDLSIYNQDEKKEYFVGTFRLTLTPYQDLILADQENATNLQGISNESKKFLKLLNFTGNFTFCSKKYHFPVIKLISKQLACFEGKILQPHEYQLDKKTGKLFENKTGNYFSLKDYSILEGGGGNITLCRKLVLSGCTEGSFVPLRHNEYVISSNLSLYHNATNRTFEFGEYQITESLNNVNNDNSNNFAKETYINHTGERIFPRNTTFAICLPYRSRLNHSHRQDTPHTGTIYSLRILTLIVFSVSIICLLLLLITYGVFRELRTLPGLNLMNLSFSLLFSHLIWLIGTAHFQGTTLCKVFAILEHYLFLVSFLAMSVISYHSCLVFSQSFAAPKPDKGLQTFKKYSAVVWSCPAIFVMMCVILDKTGVFAIDYGTNCWLGTKSAKLYLFLLPISLLLLYNIFTFIHTAVILSQHQKQSHMLRKRRKQNLMICTKLATLVGFPWIFAFFGVLFPDVEALEYLFVIFVCLQGFYIGVAFLCNKRTLKLYKDRWNQKRKLAVGFARRREHNPTPTFHVS